MSLISAVNIPIAVLFVHSEMLFGSVSCLNSGLSRWVGGDGGESDYLSSHGGLRKAKFFIFLQTTRLYLPYKRWSNFPDSGISPDVLLFISMVTLGGVLSPKLLLAWAP